MLSVLVGLEAGAVLILQSQVPLTGSRTSVAPSVLFDLEVRVPIAGPLELGVLGAAGVNGVRKDSGLVLVPRVMGSLAAVFTF